ncbi:MAG: 5-(carboxyamino)imidazole ribonucleotide synthase [Xenococcaceae cyanobacterium MO_188.B32]|nr:5-(carboxyamino)imidazole ribonucleotide synthase [Xenococcaceae cyanobacterium MO_188.B32]
MESKRVGVIGGGQLAWMMGEAAEKLGIELLVQTPSKHDPAVSRAVETILAPVDDAVATAKLANLCDVITFENEFINLPELQLLSQKGVCFRPSIDNLAPLLDKYNQRCYLQEIGLPVPRFTTISSASENLSPYSFPVVLKARRHGYDGQGTFILPDQVSLEQTWQSLQQPKMLLEEFIPFEKELAVIAARNVSGEITIYPVVETYQKNQVCRWVIAPADLSTQVQSKVNAIARTLLSQLQFVGVLGIELFLTEQEEVLVNEIAPRTHNSGHYTLDACYTSQFEMQLRAVTDMTLGSPNLKFPGAVMVNLLGYEYSHHDYQDKLAEIATIPEAHIHWYGKKESRPGRKLGHVTVLLSEAERQLGQKLSQKIESIWYESSN